MKKLAILLLAALLLFGCGGTNDPNAVYVDPNAIQGGGYGDLYFEADGVRFGIFDDAEPVLKALPAYLAHIDNRLLPLSADAQLRHHCGKHMYRMHL